MWNIWLRAFHAFLSTSVLALWSLPMYGQTADTGAIAGPVSDPSGALVARAVTVVKSQATLELRDLATDAWGGGRARSTAEAGWCRWREGALS
jgi:hypothetical protein